MLLGGMAPQHRLEPTSPRPASPGPEEETRELPGPGAPSLLMGRRPPRWGTACPWLPLPCPAPARQLAQTQVSLPGREPGLESPVVRAWLGLMRLPRLAGG